MLGICLLPSLVQAKPSAVVTYQSGTDLQRDLKTLAHERISHWLDEHPLDLDTTPQFQADEYFITVTPRDFKGDGDHEWLFTIRPIDAQRHVFGVENADNYLVAERDGKGGYRLIRTPLPWFSEGFGRGYLENGLAQSLIFQDINADSVPEWVVAVGGVGGGYMNFGWLYVLTWRKGEIINLATYGYDSNSLDYASPAGGGASVFPFGVYVEFLKSLTNNATDIVVHHEMYDTWDCRWLETRIFSWNSTIYALSNRTIVYDDSRSCAWRNAEASAWKGDYKASIAYYQHGFHLPTTSWAYSMDATDELQQYMQIRLLLALSLNGQTQQWAELLQILKTEKPTSELMRQFIQALVPISTASPYALCLAAYNVINWYWPTDPVIDEDYSYGRLPTQIVIGMTLDNYGPPISFQGLPDPKRAGCDISVPLQRFF